MSDVPETEREKFEAWAKTQVIPDSGGERLYLLDRRRDGDYEWAATQHAARGWRAAIEAAVREQPTRPSINPRTGDVWRLTDPEIAPGLAALEASFTDPHEALEYLKKHGFLTPAGELPEKYGGSPEPQQGDSAVASEGGSCVVAPPSVVQAAQRLLDEVDARLAIKEPPLKYTAPWGALSDLRAALSTAGAQRRASEQDGAGA